MVPPRLDRRRARGGCAVAPARTSWPRSTTSHSSSPAVATACCARSTTSAATAARPSSRSRAARPSASSARTTPGSTTSMASSSGPSTPTTSTTSSLGDFGLVSVRHGDLAGLRVRQPRPGHAAARRVARRPRPHLDRFDFGGLRVAHTVTYEVDANWKFIAENYSECYHCPGIHPQLNKLTPYDLGGDFAPDGPWQGGWMELVDNAETMAIDGGHRRGRPAMRGHHAGRRAADLLLPDLADDVPVDPPRLPARPPARAGRAGPYPDRLPVAVRARDDRRARSSTRPTPSSSGTSPIARTGTSASSSSAARGRGAGRPAATRTRSRASTRST